jgi:hypothetical protein
MEFGIDSEAERSSAAGGNATAGAAADAAMRFGGRGGGCRYAIRHLTEVHEPSWQGAALVQSWASTLARAASFATTSSSTRS